jgi:hypothetical protein
MGRRVARAARRLGQCSGKLIVIKFPEMMGDVREDQKGLRELVNGRKVKAHSAGTLVAKELVDSGAEVAWAEFYNEVVTSKESELVEGGWERFNRHALASLPWKKHPVDNFRVTTDSGVQSVLHGPSNYGHLAEISDYTAADHIEVLAERGTPTRRLIGVNDEFKDFAQARDITGVPTLRTETCHDGLLLDPRETQDQLQQLPFVA